MATAQQNEQFTKTIMVTWPLDDALAWIQTNLEPDEVFTEDQLQENARRGYPEETFTEEELQDWAKRNGYVLGND